MNKYLINGGKKLYGKVYMHGAKNAFLPIIAASIMADGLLILRDAPKISDIDKMTNILVSLGCEVSKKGRDIYINTFNCNGTTITNELMNGIRASIFMLGPMLAKFKKAQIAYPGGCAIGLRPIDIHLNGLRALNVNIIEEHGQIICDGSNMKSGNVHLKFASVGATENLVMSSVFLKGTTILNNVACEPEIVDLCNFLNKMGAKIKGAGTSTITIEGVKKLNPTEYTPITDRIVAGTFLLTTLLTQGEVEICNINPKFLTSLLDKFVNNNCVIKTENDRMIVKANKRLNSVPLIETMPYPLFPTDLQAQIMALQTVSKGTSIIVENLFDSRFKQVAEFVKMGANIVVQNNKAVITGVEKLSGAEVNSTDLRAGASLVMAGLVAQGYTTVNNINFIDRGYENFETDLANLGADIKRIE